MKLLFLLLLALPVIVIGYVAWRLIRNRKWIAGMVLGLFALVFFLVHPTVQMGADELIAYPYAKKKETLALEYDIVGKNYSYVVEKLGPPNRTRVVHPTVLKSATREITKQGAVYQAMDYFVSPAIYVATRFIVFLDEKGNVKSHRVKWEHGEGR